MAYPAPAGVSALIDDGDEPIIAILEECARLRRALGLPAYSRDDLERLFRVLDAAPPHCTDRANVVALDGYRRPRGFGTRR